MKVASSWDVVIAGASFAGLAVIPKDLLDSGHG